MELWKFAKELMNVPLGLTVLFGCGICCGFILSRKRLEKKISSLEKRVEELEMIKTGFLDAQEQFDLIHLQTEGDKLYVPNGDYMTCIPHERLLVGLTRIAKALKREIPLYKSYPEPHGEKF